jgi:hypothetical protein
MHLLYQGNKLGKAFDENTLFAEMEDFRQNSFQP